jgi:hypothetical protein
MCAIQPQCGVISVSPIHLLTSVTGLMSLAASTIQFLWAYAALGAALCIARHLEWITSPCIGSPQRPHRMLFEIALCCVSALLSIPISMLIARSSLVHQADSCIPIGYILSYSRYAILEDVGCVFNLRISTLWVVLRSVPEFILAFGSFAFSCEINSVVSYTILTPTCRYGCAKPHPASNLHSAARRFSINPH